MFLDLSQILKAAQPLTLAGVENGFQPLLLGDIARAFVRKGKGGRLFYIAPDDQAARAIIETAPYFTPELETLFFPAWDCLPYDRASPSLSVSANRIATLYDLQRCPKTAQLVVTTIEAATQRVLTPFRLRQLSQYLAPNARIDRDQLVTLLRAHGYQQSDTVSHAGDYAIRGGLIDLWPSGLPYALRLDFFGDEIESLRQFDPVDQRSISNIESFTLLPASEALLDPDNIKRFRSGYRDLFGATATTDPLYQAISEGRRLSGMEHWLPLFEEKLVTVFDHLSTDDAIFYDQGCIKAAEQRFEAILDYYGHRKDHQSQDAGSYRPLKPDMLYLNRENWLQNLESWPAHQITAFHHPPAPHVIDLEIAAPRDFAPERSQGGNIYEAVVDYIGALNNQNKRVILASYSKGSRERLAGLLSDHGLKRVIEADTWQEALGAADISRSKISGAALMVLPIDHGFLTTDIALLSEQDILGDRLVRRAKRRKSADAFMAELASLTPGDLVVHSDHGIGCYEGLTSIPVGSAPHDCVALSYQGGDKLYVPVENIDTLSRYGNAHENTVLDKLGGVAWQTRKSKMKERIRAIAGQLMATAAQRVLRSGPVALADPASYPLFVDRFPYQETDDQERAISDVIEDLAKGKPMDRLICGDVGFGKTEVALRAAFIAAMAGFQVVLVCPTTLLARQHYSNFIERFEGFPLKIGRLSRLVPAKEAKICRQELAEGTMDIVIGTHAVLSKTIQFKRLGLVIVDEEQHFGVVHKERLKALKNDVHQLTLTATPIPRTLQMAMSGLRELSVIQTPPIDRLAVRSYVMPWDPVAIREALLREHYRGGQSFIVVPRISDLVDLEKFLTDQVPEVRFVIAHGQMAASEVEERMAAFYDKRFDVLLSTTIVESGLDIPSANTMIVYRADRFGLSQLYQIRGRVGRSKTRAYAYMTTPINHAISETAEKRLHILSTLDSLGAGFQLASHDLDIRGAGNLLGDEQSGHIKEVGFELYQSMLEDAILEAKSGDLTAAKEQDEFSPQITIDAPILIPESYVPDLNLRMALYRRMSDIKNREDIDAFAAELIDRFGSLPQETKNLMAIIEIKTNCRQAHIIRLDGGPRGALISFNNDNFPNVTGLLNYIQKLKGTAKLRPDQKLVIQRNWPDQKSRLNGLVQLSRGLAKVALAG
ncbi:transcription-repair coupling factor [Zymomonas mobilis]|uniref:Transcription-repair-coupling factor n=1 Tax=Zymomonas mobilis subsp. pomaceae (strain ATCC 29192 / DSM 22645 / JCM 10191 / CCUG 17912 / NBRC 13757 / NCIMB 11200 / NRRL B-4491 / Barker I) TaxID=579138 RepID=F8EVM2_ZYMMT|nr:transcription-repair coupling factor [Zymomonas mobilis]AEI38359.1 transcription-repair coupling factor [Zymomonas mobilis subsp. pomaceae ATCC 29192]MDX5948048.1 transcription-repair coupling factor [Zymomonas mobilis subsp. pomaceae]GEB89378.1 transcription-repair-coupling factor [Zymomonas mobilis subsp. pomaceae]